MALLQPRAGGDVGGAEQEERDRQDDQEEVEHRYLRMLPNNIFSIGAAT
jgi:hypothetical protein